MAEAIIAPYTEASQVLSTTKKEIFTLSNFTLTSSFTGYDQHNRVSNGYGSGGVTVSPAFWFLEYAVDASRVSHTRPSEFSNKIFSILCSPLCEVEKCVVEMSVQYKSHANLSTDIAADLNFGIGVIELRQIRGYPNVLLSSSSSYSWKYGWPVKITNNSAVATTANATFDLIASSSNNLGYPASTWRNYNSSDIGFGIVATNNYVNNSVNITGTNGSISLIMDAKCTIIYEDFH